MPKMLNLNSPTPFRKLIVISLVNFVRTLSWRIGRFLYCRSRGEFNNNPRSSGEYALIESVVRLLGKWKKVRIFDIGANKGEWSDEFLKQMNIFQGQVECEFHLFEPVPELIAYSKSTLAKYSANIKFCQKAVADVSGSTTFYLAKSKLAGSHSLFVNSREASNLAVVQVETISLNGYLQSLAPERIHFIKIDTEGNDFAILRQCRDWMVKGEILFIQFEYNHRWIASRHFLKDVFDFLTSLPYRIGKITPFGVEIIDSWHEELDRFFECNYLIVSNEVEGLDRLRSGAFTKFNSYEIRVQNL